MRLKELQLIAAAKPWNILTLHPSLPVAGKPTSLASSTAAPPSGKDPPASWPPAGGLPARSGLLASMAAPSCSHSSAPGPG